MPINKRIYKNYPNQIDALDLMSQLADNSIDTTLTDPLYDLEEDETVFERLKILSHPLKEI